LFGVWDEGISGWVFNKNGTSQSIVDTATNIAPTGLAVLGDDMYISGFSSYHDGSVPDAPTDYHAQCWKNGQLIFRENKTSGAYAIFIHQNNIYMAGTQGNVACYWKNGARVDLTDGSAPSIAKSIFVTDAHVYVSGMLNYQAVYWKDGAIIPLTTEGTNSMANSIFVHGEDVHVGGYEHRYPAYWKNDVKQNIANQDKPGEIKFVVVGSN
jgi:hypothetical protein